MTKRYFVIAASVIGFTAFCASAQAHETIGHPVSPHQNVVNSMRYERMVQHNARFRHMRMHKECGPIADPELRQNCMASFYR